VTLADASQPDPAGDSTAVRGALLLGGFLQGLEKPGVGLVGRGLLGEGEL
jgi:hypothetical protein